MTWVELKTQKPKKTFCSYCMEQDDRVLIHGYDVINFSRRYDVMYRDDLTELQPQVDGRYIARKIIITHWAYIERPL